MNLFQMATRGVDLGALPDEEAPRPMIDFGPAASPVARGAVPAGMDDLFDAAAAEYGVDPTILKGIAYAESRFRPDIISGKVTSPAGAVGLMQFMPATAREMGINPLDPVESVFGAAAYLRQSLDKFGGDTERAIASYNWGRNREAFAREDWYKSLPPETRNYVGTVLEFADGVAAKAPVSSKTVPLPAGAPASQAGAAPVLPARREVPGMSVGSVAQDVASGALQIGPTAVKGLADLARLVTGDSVGKDLSDYMEEGIKSIQGVVGSERAAAQRENFQRDMADPNVSIGQALANNKGALADQVLPTLGSMLLPVGAVSTAGKLATAGKVAAGLDKTALAARVAGAQTAAGIGTTAAQNAADVFAGLVDKGVPMEDAYKAAGITVPFSVIAGKLAGGGAEVALARQVAGQAVRGGAMGVAKGAAREGFQEVGEELGQVTGEAVGTGETPNATNVGKRLAVAGTLGTVVGGGVDVAGNLGAKAAAAPPPAPRVEDQSTTPQAPPVPPRQEPTIDVTYETADGRKVTEVVRGGDRSTPAGEGEISIADAVGQARAELGGKVPAARTASPAPGVPAVDISQPGAQAVPTQPETGPLSPTQKQEIARARTQALMDAAPEAAPQQLQTAPSTTQADVRQMASEASDRVDAEIGAMVAADEQAARQRSDAETQQGQQQALDLKARQRIVDDLAASYGEANGYFASRTLPAIEQQLQALEQSPLTQAERERVAEVLGRAQAFVAPNLPSDPPRPPAQPRTMPDRGADNSSLEAQIPERAVLPPAPAPEAQTIPGVTLSNRENGMLDVTGDAAAVRSRLVAAGIDNRAIRNTGKGVTVSKGSALRARQALSMPAAPAPAPAVTAPEAANASQRTAAQTASTTAGTVQAPNIGGTDAPVPAAAVPAAGRGAAGVQAAGVRPTNENLPNRRVSGTDTASGVERSGSSNSGEGAILARGAQADGVTRDIGRYGKGLSRARAYAVQAELAAKNPGMAYTVERAADLPNGFAVAGRPLNPGETAPAPLPQLQMSMAPKQPTDLVPNADGGVDYGEITPEMGRAMRRQAGVIRLQEGVQNADGSGWGRAHIEANHGDQIRALGMSVPDFVARVAGGIQQVWQVPGNSQLLVTMKDGRKDVMYIQLDIAKEGDFYRVNTAFPVRQQDYEARKGMKMIWDGSEPTSAATGQRPAYATAASASPENVSSQGSSNARGQDDSVPPNPPEVQQSREMSPDLAAEIMRLTGQANAQPAMATVESVQAAVDELVGAGGRLPGGLGSVVVTTSDRIAPDWEPLIGPVAMDSESAGRALGFYAPPRAGDPRGGTVFLIADNIPAGQEMAVAAHELMHKHGQAVLGKKGWDLLHDTIGGWANAPEGSLERQVYDDAAARVEASRPAGADAGKYSTQELFPYAVQVAIEKGVQPTGARPITTVQGWLARVRNSIQQVWGKITGRPETFDGQDLVNLAFGIAQRENPAHAGELDGAAEADAAADGGPQYSRAAAPPPVPAAPAAQPAAGPARGGLPAETGFRKVQRVMQDKLNRITVLSNWARENDIELSSEADVWGYEARMHGTVATRVEDFREGTVKPVIDRIQKAGFTTAQVAEYLHAAHAQERNAQIRSIDPKTTDGSGMTDADAQAILAKAPQGLATLAAEVQTITDSTRQILLDAGIISQEMADAWSAAYKNYVPLKGGDENTQGGVGKGLSVDGRQKRALGHGARDEKIIENILRDHERAIMLAEKNKVGQAMLVLVDELNNPDIATINQPERRRVLKQGTMYEARTPDGIVVDTFTTSQQALRFVQANPDMKLQVRPVRADPAVVSMATPMLQPNEAQVYVQGHAVRVQLNDEGLARAYQNMGVANVTTLMKINREINATLSKAYTAYNPEFLFKNMARDFTAGLTITTAKYGAGVAARAVKNYPGALAKLLRFGFTKKASGSLMAYRLAGGSTGAAYLADLARIGEDVRATFDDARGVAATARADGALRGASSLARQSLRFGLKYLEILNAAGESAMRLSVFEAMQETGHDTRESASAAKELMNFNRTGEATRSVGGWFLFLNASIQGTAAVADAMVNGKHRAQGWAMVAAMAALQYTLRSLQFGDDDEGKKAWGRISDDTKTKNLIFRTGEDSYAKMPLPYGLAAFYALGNAAYDIEHGEQIDKAALRVALTFADQFLPIKPYSETGDMRALVEAVPGAVGGELARAGMRAAVNRSGLGGDIVPDSKFDEGKPDNLKAYRSTRTSVYQDIATKLNAATGGTQTQAGLVDVSPESLRYWVRTLTGGAGAFVADVAGLVRLGKEYYDSEGDPERSALMPELSEVPIVRGFMGEDRIADDRRQYWQAAKEVGLAHQDSQRAKKAGDEEGLQRVDDQRGELLHMVKTMERSSKWIREIRDEVEEIMLDETTSMAFKRAAVKRLEAEESQIYREFTDMVAEDKADAAKERSSAGK